MAGGSNECKTCRDELARLRADNARLVAESADLLAMLVELERALAASEAELARYRELCLAYRPNRPERVPTADQQLVFEQLLTTGVGCVAANDVGEGKQDAADAPGAGGAETRSDAGAKAVDDAPHGPPAAPGGSGRGRLNRDKHGRRCIDLSALPVETVVLEPQEVRDAGGKGYTLIGTDKSDRLAYSPARYTRLHIVRRTFRADAPPAADFEDAPLASVLVTAPIPDAVWPGVFADPSAIAHTIISKYDDVLPLHRQETISRREGFSVARSTLCGWLTPAHAVLTHVVDAMFEDVKATAFCIATDATSAPVRAKRVAADESEESSAAVGQSVSESERGPCSKWHVFAFVAEKDHIVFRHSKTHDSAALRAMLSGYSGYLLGDATSIYSPLVRESLVVLVCCWAHVRRYFYRALESDRARAMEAIAIIGQLFAVERAVAHLPMPARTAERAARARPILALFDNWVAAQQDKVDPRSPLHRALVYAENQRTELRRFLEDGRLRIDNNICEGILRNLVLGRNAWQYFRNERGLEWYTVFRSLIASCKLHEICPERYLECVLRLAPHWPKARVLELSPKYWRATAARLSPAQLDIVSPSWSSAFDPFRSGASAVDAVPTAA